MRIARERFEVRHNHLDQIVGFARERKLVSDFVGCQRDLVTDGITGWVFCANDPPQLGRKLSAALAALGCDAAGFKSRVVAHISGYTYAQATKGLLRALDAASSSG